MPLVENEQRFDHRGGALPFKEMFKINVCDKNINVNR